MLFMLIHAICNKAKIRIHLLNELSQRYADELIAEAVKSHANALVSSHGDTLLRLLTELTNVAFHYGQEGEDIILNHLLGKQESGFFVDVGAHHPTRFSNTYTLYRRGWRGINIDATPGSMAAFAQWRPQDINIEAAVADTEQPMPFHMFKEPALNTFDAGLAESYVQAGWERQEIKDITPRPLAGILDEYLPPGTRIDLMSIDVEGKEMDVFCSNNWEKYAPRFLVLEILDTPLTAIMNAPAILFLRERGYVPIAKLMQSVILQKKENE
jgi:hypothetical protein